MKVLQIATMPDGRLLVAAYTRHRKLTRVFVDQGGKVTPVILTCPTDASFARLLGRSMGKKYDKLHVERAVAALDF